MEKVIIPEYFVIELLSDIHKDGILCTKEYKKGDRVMAWEDKQLKTYHAANTNDCISCTLAKKIFKFVGEEIKEYD